MDSVKSGVELIAAERERQIMSEGWTPAHDDGHDDFELTSAAVCYAEAATDSEREHERMIPSLGWPWADDWWKPSADPIRNLVKAGALIAAEIDRLQRRKD